MQSIDSTRIIHGKFSFKAQVDTVVMASLFLEETSLMPIVLDNNEINITLNDNGRKIEGSVLNDSLIAFIDRKAVIDDKLAEIPHRESQMIMDGMDHAEVVEQLNAEIAELSAQEQQMLMQFIKDNSDNVLGTGVFMIATSSLPYPVLTPELEEILTLAPASFNNDEYVRDYVKAARENMEKMAE